jgi:hypothetical protein
VCVCVCVCVCIAPYHNFEIWLGTNNANAFSWITDKYTTQLWSPPTQAGLIPHVVMVRKQLPIPRMENGNPQRGNGSTHVHTVICLRGSCLVLLVLVQLLPCAIHVHQCTSTSSGTCTTHRSIAWQLLSDW